METELGKNVVQSPPKIADFVVSCSDLASSINVT